MTAVDTDTSEHFLLDFERDAQDGVNFRGDEGVVAQEAVFVAVMEAVDGHAWLACFDGTPGAALADGYVYTSYVGAIHAIVGQDVQLLLFVIQSEDA